MGEKIRRGYVPFGEFKPDLRLHANDGLADAVNVIPVYGDYLSMPTTSAIASLGLAANESAFGLSLASANRNGYVLIKNPVGGYADLKEITEGAVVTNRTRTAANNYALLVSLTGGCSFGSNVIINLFDESTPANSEPVQLLTSGAARFVNMITSAFAPIGKYSFSLGGNLFLAHCHLPANFDTLTAGLNNTLVAWSQTENVRSYGSFNVTPELTGTGYQPLNYDLGEISGAVAVGDFAVIALTDGLVVVDQAKTFRAVARGHGVSPFHLNAICAAGPDVYYIGPSGLMRLPAGADVPERIGIGKFSRFLTDDASGYSAAPLISTPLSLRYCPLTDLLFLQYVTTDSKLIVLVYNIGENRATYWMLGTGSATTPQYIDGGSVRISSSGGWCPGRDLRFIRGNTHYGKFALGNSGLNPVLGRGYMQFDPDFTTRFLRIRPIYSVTDQAAIEQITVSIDSTNKPYKTPTTFGPYSTLDNHGWIVTPATAHADFHAPKFTLTASANMHKVVEYQGFEYEIEVGGKYSA